MEKRRPRHYTSSFKSATVASSDKNGGCVGRGGSESLWRDRTIVRVSFRSNEPTNGRGICNEKEKAFGQADRGDAKVSGASHGDIGYHPSDRDFRVAVLPMEKAI